MGWLRRLQRVRTSTWVLLGIFVAALVVYLLFRPPSTNAGTPASTQHTTSPATSHPSPTTPTPSPKATHASPTPGLGRTPHSSVSPSPSPSPSPLGSPSPSASDPTPSPQAS